MLIPGIVGFLQDCYKLQFFPTTHLKRFGFSRLHINYWDI
jgi:hypothetical protein